MQRRDFIRSSCINCAGILGAGALFNLLQACAPLPMLKVTAGDKTVVVPFSTFPEGQNLLLVKKADMEFDILLVKMKTGGYNALYMQCTHQNQPLTANKNGLFCASHGSAFDFEGHVTQDPATQPLRKFRTEVDDTSVKIFIA